MIINGIFLHYQTPDVSALVYVSELINLTKDDADMMCEHCKKEITPPNETLYCTFITRSKSGRSL